MKRFNSTMRLAGGILALALAPAVKEPVPVGRAYDFSFALEADRQLTQTNWRP